MQFPRKKIIISFLLFALLFSLFLTISCRNSSVTDPNVNQDASNNSASPENTKAPKDNVEELSNIIKLPEVPEEAVWREDETQQPKGKKLIAVLKYTPENINKIIALVEKSKSAAPIQIGAEEWFPEELTAQTQLSGNESLKGTVYGANEFFNPPYRNGRLVRIQDTNYFVLELTTY